MYKTIDTFDTSIISKLPKIVKLEWDYENDTITGDHKLCDFVIIHNQFMESMNTYNNYTPLFNAKECVYNSIKTLKNKKTYGYIIGSDILGFITINPRKFDKSLFIEEIFVKENCRNVGIGSTLLDFTDYLALKKFNYKNIQLSVHESNNSAKKLYIKKGFNFK
jgi:ribosomal protein S18 acetylase RimI-like enzyme